MSVNVVGSRNKHRIFFATKKLEMHLTPEQQRIQDKRQERIDWFCKYLTIWKAGEENEDTTGICE